MGQTILVYCVVAVAALHVGWKFMPAMLRSQLAVRLGATMRRCGLGFERTAWLEATLNRGGACGSCDSCGADRGAGKSKAGCAESDRRRSGREVILIAKSDGGQGRLPRGS